jgi:rhodanese-related sulfurtransferase
MKMIIPSWKRTIRQITAICFAALIIGAGINQARVKGIPLVGDWSARGRITDSSGSSMIISLEDARRIFEANAAIFLDARPREQYELGHIRGSFSLPWQEVEKYFTETLNQLSSTKTIITYCDGETCELSHRLAVFMKEMGFKDVRVLVNGWSLWKEAMLPID